MTAIMNWRYAALMISIKPTLFAKRLLMRRELIFLLTSTALSTSLRWNKIAGLAFAGLLRLKNGKLEDVDSLSSILDYS